MSEHVLIERSRALAYAVFGQALTRELMFLVKRPYRFVCRHSLDLRFPFYRSWKSGVPIRLMIAMQRGYARNFAYKGLHLLKSPVDLALYTELLWQLKPLTIIEVGSMYGASALWLADHSEAFVVSIDLNPPALDDERITFLKGDERNLERVDLDWRALPHPWLVINDASHDAKTMLPGMLYLDQWLQKGDYFVIEDGNCAEMDWLPGGGPCGAIWKFLKERPHYRVDARYCDRYGYNVTNNPNGYLVRT